MYNLSYIFFSGLGMFSVGFAISFLLVSICIYDKDKNRLLTNDDIDDYYKKYYEDYYNLDKRELTNDELLALLTNYLHEETPNGKIIMCYSSDNESFNYWCDNKNISFKTLETVAQKYAIENNVKQVCIDDKEEYEKAIERVKTSNETKKNIVENSKDNSELNNNNNIEEKKNVFAKFKSYNTVNKSVCSEEKNNVILIEKCNKFKYKGKIYDWKEEYNKNSIENATEKTMSITEWIKQKKNTTILSKNE